MMHTRLLFMTSSESEARKSCAVAQGVHRTDVASFTGLVLREVYSVIAGRGSLAAIDSSPKQGPRQRAEVP